MIINNTQGAYINRDKEDLAVRVIKDLLPHGSGINGDWRFEVLKNGKIVFSNGYHGMDENGFYDGWVDFRVKLIPDKEDFILTFGKENRSKSWFYGLRDCLEDTFQYSLFGSPESKKFWMKEYLKSQFGDENDDDIEIAIYYYVCHYHTGQTSDLYSILSTSPYKPGLISNLESEGKIVEEMYQELINKYEVKK